MDFQLKSDLRFARKNIVTSPLELWFRRLSDEKYFEDLWELYNSTIKCFKKW